MVTAAGHPGNDIAIGTLRADLKEVDREGDQGPTQYAVICEKGDSTWGDSVADLPGEIAAGEAVEFHIEGFSAEGLAAPPPARWAGALEIVAAWVFLRRFYRMQVYAKQTPRSGHVGERHPGEKGS